jgi:DNA invertase Pin-like site-specific DNA recombinase
MIDCGKCIKFETTLIMIQMEAVVYSRVSSESQDNERQIINLKAVAQDKGWYVRRTFQEKISGTAKAESRLEFKSLIAYLEKTHIDVVMVSEISRVGRRVVDVLNIVEFLHEKGIALYVQQFNMLTYESGKENPITKMLLQMLSIGAEMENSQRKIRQKEGIKLAQMKNVYTGRKKGAKSSPTTLIKKYKNIVDLFDKSSLSIRKIAVITGHSVNTVRKIRQLKEL